MASLCLNMIVKNEADKIIRCLDSVAPYIDCYAIADTGSTDGTQKIIKEFFSKKNIPGTITQVPFINFEQARNAGLKVARASTFAFDYIFLLDADMELAVTNLKFKDNLTAPAYNILQQAGGVSYFNTRLVRRDQTGLYIGVTHEYLDVGSQDILDGVSFIDHADGSNRKDKFKRDIKLLRAALKKDPTNSRYQYYLAQSYRDAGQKELAASAYLRRAEMGGWEEEVWSARLNYAHCLHALGDKAGFIRELLTAYNFRPSRAEPLYDLAKYYRENTQQCTSLLYSDAGMKIPYPKDVLFVTDHVYQYGMREEYSICAFYHPAHRKRGYQVCSDLAIDPKCTEWNRELARNNLFHYIQPLKAFCPSIREQRISFNTPDRYTMMNPSIANVDGSLRVLLRTVNYTMDIQGRYLIKDTNGEANSTNPIHTRNFLLNLNRDLVIETSREILSPEGMPAPLYNLVIGFEDMRLFEWQRELWTSSTVRELNAEGRCDQVLVRLEPFYAVYGASDSYHNMALPTKQHEKNWMPWVDGTDLKFVYKLGTMIDPYSLEMRSTPVPYNVDRLSGGTQVIPFHSGWLAMVHESRTRPGDGTRYYQHRFVFWDRNKTVQRTSQAFVLHDRQIEFAAGLAWHPDKKRLIISYGIKDCEAWLATVDWHEVANLLAGV